MRDLGFRPQTRVKGRPALLRSLRGLLVRAHRYASARATTDTDRLWSARLIDALTLAVQTADPGTLHTVEPTPDHSQRPTS
jgi:hypothetical protein